MALVPSLAMVSPQTGAGQNRTCMLTVRNTGGTDVVISSIQTYLANPAASGYVAQPQFPPGSTLTVVASGSLSLPFSVVFLVPPLAGMGLAAATPTFYIGCTVYSNDATTPVAAALNIAVGVTPVEQLTQAQNPTSPGWLDFTQPANTGLLALGIY